MFETIYIEKQINKHPRTLEVLARHPNARLIEICLLYTSPSPRDATLSRMPSSA